MVIQHGNSKQQKKTLVVPHDLRIGAFNQEKALAVAFSMIVKKSLRFVVSSSHYCLVPGLRDRRSSADCPCHMEQSAAATLLWK